MMFARNVAEGRGGVDLIGVDAATGEVRWEIEYAGIDATSHIIGAPVGATTSASDCMPAVDSQGRVWVHHSRPGSESPYVMAYDVQTGEPRSGTRVDLPRPACLSAGALQIGGAGEAERLLITAYPTDDFEHHGYLAAEADGSLLAIVVSGGTPSVAWQLDVDGVAGPEPTFDVLLGSGPIPWSLWQGSRGFSRPVVAVDDTAVYLPVGVEAGDGFDVELRQLALADGEELGRAAMPHPAMSPDRSGELLPTQTNTYFAYQLLTDGSSLVVSARDHEFHGRLRTSSEDVMALGFLAAFDVAGGLSDPPRWRHDGDVADDGPLEGDSAGNFGTIGLGNGVVVTQPRERRGGYIARDLATGQIAWETPNEDYRNRHGRTPMDADGALYTVVSDAWNSHAVKIDATGAHEWAVTDWGLVAADAQPIVPAQGNESYLRNAAVSIVDDEGTVYFETHRGPRSTMLALDNSADVGVFAPEAPTGVTAEHAPGELVRDRYRVEVSWEAPSDPRFEVERYEVTAEPSGRTCTTSRGRVGDDPPGQPPETTCAILADNNARNTFTVVAFNPVGESPASDPSDPVVLGDPPDEPDPEPTEPTDPTDPVDPVVPEGDRCVRSPQRVNQFDDVPDDSVFCNDIAWMAEQDITTGRDDGTYGPGDSVRRGHMAAFLHRYAGEPDPAPGAPSFPDVPTGFVFETAISWLAAQGITTGMDDGTFDPGGEITRGQMAAFLYRFAGEPPLPPGAPSFPDVPEGNVFEDAISWMAVTEITTGRDDGTFNPAGTLNRGQMSAFLSRYDALDDVG